MASAKVKVNVLPQASVAVAVAKAGVAGQLIVVFAGNAAITGAELSVTVMVWDAVDMFIHASVAVHVLVILYDPVHAPGVVTSTEVRTNVLPQASIAVATAKEGIEGQLIVVAEGKDDITGAVLSITLMVCEDEEVFPQASVAVQVRFTL